MKLKSFLRLSFLWVLISCNKPEAKLIRKLDLPSYPSSSAITYLNNHYYIVGDDAISILILDSALNISGRIPIYDSSYSGRIAKENKFDPETLTNIRTKEGDKLLLLGSGSLPSRDTALIVDPISFKTDRISLTRFYNRFRKDSMNQVNIEGASHFANSFILANRGNQHFRKNHLIVVPPDFYYNQDSTSFEISKLGFDADKTIFSGISDLAYSEKSDCLIASITTELNTDNYHDGEIGKSYLWMIANFSRMKGMSAINPVRIIDLTAIDHRFAGQKIEGLTITNEDKSSYTLLLVADNDDGQSAVFEFQLYKK